MSIVQTILEGLDATEPKREGFELEHYKAVTLANAAPDLMEALRMQAKYILRDGTPCACQMGWNEYAIKGDTPQVHSIACEMLRAALAKVDGVTP